MIWNSKIETGIALIDEQHKEIFRQADILLDSKSKDRIPEVIKFLENYIGKHFSDEQGMHNASQYPKAAQHKQYHVAFVEQFKKVRDEYQASGHNLSVVLKINKAVVSWLTDHIMVHDKEFAAFQKSKNA